jgi:hypothetical protein
VKVKCECCRDGRIYAGVFIYVTVNNDNFSHFSRFFCKIIATDKKLVNLIYVKVCKFGEVPLGLFSQNCGTLFQRFGFRHLLVVNDLLFTFLGSKF